MAHARLIRQNFYTDPLIAEKYKIEERYFLIGLACHADDFGRFWYNEASIRATIFPTDESITKEWIKTCLKKFIDDFILCEYEVNEVRYGHFPRWFQKGWFLKQRVDHPREYASPDCPLCETEKRKREISRAIKDKSTKHKKIKELNLDIFYGDSDSDIIAALKAGVHPVRVVRNIESIDSYPNNYFGDVTNGKAKESPFDKKDLKLFYKGSVGVFGESIYPIKWEGPSRKRE